MYIPMGESSVTEDLKTDQAPVVGVLSEHVANVTTHAFEPSPHEPIVATPAVDPELTAYRRKLAEAEREYIESGMTLANIREQIANLKQQAKDAEEMWLALGVRLRGMREDKLAQLDLFPDDPLPERQPYAPSGVADKKYAVRRGGQRVESSKLPPDRWEPPCTEATYWRHASVEELELDTVPKLGARKLAAFKDAVPTIGHLEDLRIEAAREFVHLHKKLPKGFGEATADELTERLLTWLSKNREAPPRRDLLANTDSQPIVAETAIDPDLFLMAAEEVDDRPQGATPNSPIPAQLTSRYEQLCSEGFVVELVSDNQDFQFGYYAQKDDYDVPTYSMCPHSQPGERQDHWLMGFIAAERGTVIEF